MGSRSQHKPGDVVLDHIPPVLEFAKAALELAPVPGLPLIIDALSAIVARVKDARANSEAATAFFAKAKELHTVVFEMVKQASAGGGDLSELQSRLDQLLSTLGELRDSANTLKGGPGFRGHLRSFWYAKRNGATLDDINQRMDNALAVFTLRTQVSTEMAVMNAEERSILESIPHCDSAGYRSVDETKSGFMQGTRVELFVELQEWCTTGFPADSPKRLYHLSGSAGLGKSAVAHQLCTRIEKVECKLNLGGSFFFVRGSGDRESARSLFPTLAYQLARLQPLLRPRIVQAAREYVKHGTDQQVKISFERLLLEPLTDAPESLADHPVTFLVIDGLDECKDRELVPELLRCLLELVRRVPWLRLFIASRPEPHILPILVSSDNRGVVYHRSLNDTKEDWKDDVALFLRATVPKIGRHGDYVRVNPHVLDRLIARAQGVFIFARVAVRFLDLYDDDPEEQFRCLFASTGIGMVALDSLYLHILRRAFPSEDMVSDRARQDRMKRVLLFIALRKCKLSVGSIALLVNITDTQALWIFDRLRSVVLVDGDGDVVPVHATFGEFLLDKDRCTDALYHVDSAKGHALLASRCLAEYSFDTITHFLRCKSQGTECSFTWYIKYVMGYWDDHLQLAEHSAALDSQVYEAVQMQLPIMVRMRMGYSTGWGTSIQKYLKGADALGNECCQLGQVYADWWHHSFQYDSDVAWHRFHSIMESLELDWMKCGEESIILYRTALKDLMEKIRLSSTEGLWYNGDLR